MAGHSQFSNIKHRKSAQDHKRSKKFTKIRREIFISAREGSPHLESNPRLRSAINLAKKQGFPKDKIEDAIKSACNKQNSENYQEVLYEGYGPFGVAVLIKTLTDNRSRSASDIRCALSRSGGSLGEPGCVAFLFEELGFIQYGEGQLKYDQVLDCVIEMGATDLAEEENSLKIICPVKEFEQIRDAAHDRFGNSEISKIFWKPNTVVNLDQEKEEALKNLLSELEDCNDVQCVYTNARGYTD